MEKKKSFYSVILVVIAVSLLFVTASAACANNTDTGKKATPPDDSSQAEVSYPIPNTAKTGGSKVYFTSDISAAGLVKVYRALGVQPAASDNVAVKISTGEPPRSNYLRTSLIGDLITTVNGDIVECNTAYGGQRASTAMSYQVAADHGFTAFAEGIGRKVKIMDDDGYMDLPVTGGSHLTYDRVGKAFGDYTFYVNLAHFKGHAMAGFGGVIKNQSIGMASQDGKRNIHLAGAKNGNIFNATDGFRESMAEAAKAVQDYMNSTYGENHIIYIDVMNRLSVDCDCDGNPAEPEMNDIGIAASLDPVAVDKACLDMVYSAPEVSENSSAALRQRIESRNGYLTVVHAANIGLGSLNYELVNIDN
jgi:uncharacterized Fe-S center protein